MAKIQTLPFWKYIIYMKNILHILLHILVVAYIITRVPSEYVIPKFFEDMVPEKGSGPQARIVSGWVAVLGQHPHQANLRLVQRNGQAFLCGGSFVQREWLISAAHCTAQSVNVIVRGGVVTLDETPEYLSETSQFWNHPSYDSSRPTRVQPNDISIIKLQEPVTYTRNLQAIRLQPSAERSRNYGEIVLQASGFGATWTGGVPSRELRWVYLRGITNAQCRLRLSSTLITEASICAQWFNVTSQSTCQGDSGGPLVYTNAQGQRILVGVTSFGAGRLMGGCHSGRPAGFIRPGHFHKWFTQVSGIDFENLHQ